MHCLRKVCRWQRVHFFRVAVWCLFFETGQPGTVNLSRRVIDREISVSPFLLAWTFSYGSDTRSRLECNPWPRFWSL